MCLYLFPNECNIPKLCVILWCCIYIQRRQKNRVRMIRHYTCTTIKQLKPMIVFFLFIYIQHHKSVTLLRFCPKRLCIRIWGWVAAISEDKHLSVNHNQSDLINQDLKLVWPTTTENKSWTVFLWVCLCAWAVCVDLCRISSTDYKYSNIIFKFHKEQWQNVPTVRTPHHFQVTSNWLRKLDSLTVDLVPILSF